VLQLALHDLLLVSFLHQIKLLVINVLDSFSSLLAVNIFALNLDHVDFELLE
jgi:hypothetical protein